MADMTFSSAMTALTGTITARVMTTLGLGFLSYEAIKDLANTLQSNIFSSYGAVDPAIVSVLNLAGVGEYLHIVTAAFITKAGLMAIKRIGVIPPE